MTLFTGMKPRAAAAPQSQTVKLAAPLAGLVVRIEDVPDEAFAAKMLGDGVAIDPTSGVLYAPADGEVIAVAAARHAVTLRLSNGAEILMHVGVETVGLGGEGFKVFARAGVPVKRGDPLIEFDMDRVAAKAKSLVSPIIILNEFAVIKLAEREEVARGDFLMEIGETGEKAEVATSDEVADAMHGTAVVRLAHGIHARPAAEIAERLKKLDAAVEVRSGDKTANARSVSSLMALGARNGDPVSVFARGKDAAAALAAVQTFLEADRFRAAPTAPRRADSRASERASVLRGVAATSGLGVGVAVLLDDAETAVDEAGRGAEIERELLDAARRNVRARLEKAAKASAGADILKAHVDLLDDPELVAASKSLIAKGKGAAFSWRSVMRERAAQLRSLKDARMAERAADFIDLERQVLAALSGAEGESELPQDAVLVAKEIYPSQLLRVDRARVTGICMAGGGPTSHASILAASMGIPTVVALGPATLGIKQGATLIVDAAKAEVHIDPDPAALAEARAKKERAAERRSKAKEAAREDCRTADGVRIEILANLVSAEEAADAAANFAEGCGLLRTEFLFLDRADPPTEDEQAAQYQMIADALGDRPLVIRTLDVGADKTVPYLPIEHEENPALGLRGVRASLARSDLFETQLRAILRVDPSGRCKIMAPMIASLAELRAVRAIYRRAADRTKREAPLGVMIETPAAALIADQIAAEADFLSIGTNDLAQYALAMDRGNPKVAGNVDALSPSVLRLIDMTGAAGEKRREPVSVCGGLASDYVAAPILIGLGVGALSATPSRIPELKALVRTLTIADCRRTARAALDLESAAAVRARSLEAFPQIKDWI